MFESLSPLALQQYWWVIVSLLGSVLVFSMFVQGGQTLIYAVGKTEGERSLIVASLRHRWVLTLIALIAFGGTLFASFPLLGSICFGEARGIWMLILTCFVLQTVSYKIRLKPNHLPIQKIHEYFLLLNGVACTVLMGAVAGTFFNGGVFSVSPVNLPRWETPYHGLEAAFVPHNLLLGLSVFFLVRTLALLYFLNNINSEQIIIRSKIRLLRNVLMFIVCFAAFLVILLLKDGFNYDPVTRIVNMEPRKYLHNLLATPVVPVLLLVGIVLMLYGVIRTLTGRRFTRGTWCTGIGSILIIWSLFLTAGFHHTCCYPSIYDIQDSLTVENSSSHHTLTVMSYVSLLTPFVIASVVWIRYAVNKKQKSTKQ